MLGCCTRSLSAEHGSALQKIIPIILSFIHAWRGSTVSTKVDIHQCNIPFRQIAGNCRRRGGVGCGGVSRMGPRHASGGLGRTPNPGLAVCAGQRTRASGDRAYMGEGALLAKHCFASARTHSRQRLGRVPEGDLQRPPQPDPPRHPAGTQLLLRLLPASGRHYRGCRVQPGRYPPGARLWLTTTTEAGWGRSCCCRCAWTMPRSTAAWPHWMPAPRRAPRSGWPTMLFRGEIYQRGLRDI